MYIAMYLNNRDCHCNFNDKTCNIEILICRLESSVLCFFYKNFIHRSLRYMVDMNVKKKSAFNAVNISTFYFEFYF